jgi:hypothetical protein
MGIPVRAQIVLAACGCAGFAVFLHAIDPVQRPVLPPCLLYSTTGIYCAGCGATRAMHALLNGHILTALHDNVLVISSLPLLLFIAASYAWPAWRDRMWPKTDPRIAVRWGVSAVLISLVFMAMRNLPGWPYSLLRPLP